MSKELWALCGVVTALWWMLRERFVCLSVFVAMYVRFCTMRERCYAKITTPEIMLGYGYCKHPP